MTTKKLSQKQHIAVLQQQLASRDLLIKDQLELLNTFASREKSIYSILGGRFGGETPEECAKRVVAERSTLAGKVLEKVGALKQSEDRVSSLEHQVGVLRGRLDSILAISDS